MSSHKLGENHLLRTALIFGYIAAVLLFSGLARADVSRLDKVAWFQD